MMLEGSMSGDFLGVHAHFSASADIRGVRDRSPFENRISISHGGQICEWEKVVEILSPSVVF